MNYTKLSILCFFACIFLLACSDDSGNSQAHQEAVRLSDSVRIFHINMLQQIEDMKDFRTKLNEKMSENEASDSILAQLIIRTNSDIAACQGLAKKHKVILEQHKEFIEEHENSALSVDKIELQHSQIANDFQVVSKEVKEADRKFRDLRTHASDYVTLDK